MSVGPARPADDAPRGAALLLDTPAGSIALAPARELLRLLTGVDLGETGQPEDPMQRMLLSLAIESLPSAWPVLFGATPQHVGPAQGRATLVLEIRTGEGRPPVQASLHGSDAALQAALSRDAWRPVGHDRTPLPDDWRLRVPLELGSTSIPLAMLRTLASGDVVLVESPLFDLSGQGRLRLGRLAVNGVLSFGNQPSLAITNWACSPSEPAMDTEHDVPTEDQRTPPLDEVPVRLSFELGTIELSLGELQGLAPGMVLPIAQALPPAVRIHASGRLIGAGELVEVDGRLGVQLTRFGAVS
jgi:type III secretion protein Q